MVKFHRVTALLLVLVLVAGLLPAQALAVEPETNTFALTYVNPLYADVITEADLRPLGEAQLRPYDNPRYSGDIDELVENLRSGMRSRSNAVTLYVLLDFVPTDEEFEDIALGLLAEAAAHTGAATEGDYLLWQLAGANCGGEYQVDEDGLCYLTLQYALSYYTTAEQEAQVDAAVQELIQTLNLKSKSDYGKIKAVYDYICANVTYDYDNLNNDEYTLKYTAYAALIHKTAVCQGYSLLMYRVLLESGVVCRLIVGTGNGGSHAWNIVEGGGLYYNCDSTWDAGNADYQYFMKGEENFPDHIRDEAYTTDEFTQQYPMSSQDYTSPCGENHDWDAGVVTKEPTETEEGVRLVTCRNCGETKTEVIEKLVHTHSYTDVVTAPTCTEGGYTTHTCACGHSYVDQETEALGHDLGDYTFHPEDKTHTRSCARCDYLETGDCTFDEGVILTEAVGTTPGEKKFTCTVCNGSYTEEYLLPPEEVGSGVCGENVRWTLDNYGKLTVSGSGAMQDYAQTEEAGETAPWMDCREQITSLEIQEGVTYVGSFAFVNCPNLKAASIGGTVTALGTEVFASCFKLEDISFAAQAALETIGEKCFFMCDGLTAIALPDSLKAIGAGAFQECTGLTEITLPEGIETVAPQTFAGCAALTEISLPSTLRSIENAAFSGTFRTEEGGQVILPSGLRSIGSRAFLDAEGLTGVVIPNTVTEIGEMAFAGTGLTSVIVPESVAAIGKLAFATETLETITFLGDAPDMGEDCFQGVTATATYPKENPTWTEEVMGNYGGSITWVGKKEVQVQRISGKSRYETSLAIADRLKEEMGVASFDTILVANGQNFPDALAGSYLATVKNAPILLTTASVDGEVCAYIRKNLTPGGKVYILGGTGAVSGELEEELAQTLEEGSVERLSGTTRYETNLRILEAAGINGSEILICTGANFADSLSASATGLPILLVNGGKQELNEEQIAFIEKLEPKNWKFTIIGGTAAVSEELEAALAAYGTVQRISGATREETSVQAAERFFERVDTLVLAYSWNFPDGLCGGVLAHCMDAPLILTAEGKSAAAATEYVTKYELSRGLVLGGTAAVSEETVRAIFDLPETGEAE